MCPDETCQVEMWSGTTTLWGEVHLVLDNTEFNIMAARHFKER